MKRTSVALVWVVLIGLSVTACGEPTGEKAGPDPSPVQQSLWSVDGNQVHLDCQGSGTPTVLLLAGTGVPSETWDELRGGVSTRTCAYDYPGVGDSTAVEGAMTPRIAVDALDGVLAASGEHGPYVVVGHSIAGLEARLFVGEHPEDVRGVVLFDPTSVEFLRGPDRHRLRGTGWDIDASAEQAAAVTAWPDIPVRVLGHSARLARLTNPDYTAAGQRLWERGLLALAKLSPQGTYRRVPLTLHAVYEDAPEVSLRAVEQVLREAAQG